MNYSRLLILIMLLCMVSLAKALDYNPSTLANPNIADRRVYLSDPAGLVGNAAKEKVNNTLWNLRNQTGVEVALLVVPNTGDYTEEDFATQIFEEWGIGKSDNDNGVLILIVPDQRAARIATGYGVEGVIPDISAKKILDRSVIPFMKNGDLDGAVTSVATDVAQVLSDPEAAAELKSNKGEKWEEMPESDITAEDIWALVGTMVVLIFLFSMGKFFYDNNKYKKRERYERAVGWHMEQSTYLIFAIISLGLGLIPYFLARRKYHNARNKPYKCPACKGMMHKLNEEEDNYLLSPSQDFEEKLNTVDYDVWVCNECHTVERYAFPTQQMKYTECPNCHTIAMCMVSDKVVTPSTTKHTGVGERTYECKYCHFRKNDRYKIPQKSNVGPVIAAGAALGGGSRGGGFGGGFGGGHTGGGGATGRW